MKKPEKFIRAEKLFRSYVVPLYPKDKPISEMTPWEQSKYREICLIYNQACSDWEAWLRETMSEEEIIRILVSLSTIIPVLDKKLIANKTKAATDNLSNIISK